MMSEPIPLPDIEDTIHGTYHISILVDATLLITGLTVPTIQTINSIGDTEEKVEEDMEPEYQDEREEDNDRPTIETVDIPEGRKDIFVRTEGTILPLTLREETQKQARDIREKYHETSGDTWIVKFMKNQNFTYSLLFYHLCLVNFNSNIIFSKN